MEAASQSLQLLFGRKGTRTPLLLCGWKGTHKPPIDAVLLMRLSLGDQFPVQLRHRVEALLRAFDEVRKIGVATFGSRARLLFWKDAMAQPAGNGCMTDPDQARVAALHTSGRLPTQQAAWGYLGRNKGHDEHIILFLESNQMEALG